MKRIALSSLLAALLGPMSVAACAAPLATLPPSDTYSRVETPAPQLSGEQLKLLGDINKEFDKRGLPTATIGGYESNVAAIMANVALAKIWNGSGRHFPTNQDVAAPASHETERVVESRSAKASRVNSMTDEENDAELKHLHPAQHQVSYGIAPILTYFYVTPFAKTALDKDDLKKIVDALVPDAVRGELKLGIAILPAGDADQRLWVLAIRDYTYDLTKGPPRTAAPGASFEIAGSVTDKKIEAFTVGLLAPNGKVQLIQVPVDAQGKFSATVKLPPEPGLYTFELVRSHVVGFASSAPLIVPIFAGVDPTPWPVSADPKASPLSGGTHPLAERLAKAITEYRRAHGLKPVPFDANMSAFSKAEALAFAKLADASAGPGSAQALQEFVDGTETRVHLAGLDSVNYAAADISADDYLNNYFARFPLSPLLAAQLSSPSLESIGVGVALVPNTVTKDDDLTRYAWILTTKDPTPPELQAEKPANTAPAGTAPPEKATPSGASPAATSAPAPGAATPTQSGG